MTFGSLGIVLSKHWLEKQKKAHTNQTVESAKTISRIWAKRWITKWSDKKRPTNKKKIRRRFTYFVLVMLISRLFANFQKLEAKPRLMATQFWSSTSLAVVAAAAAVAFFSLHYSTLFWMSAHRVRLCVYRCLLTTLCGWEWAIFFICQIVTVSAYVIKSVDTRRCLKLDIKCTNAHLMGD